MRAFTSSPDVDMTFLQMDLPLSLNAGVPCQAASLTQMQAFKTSGLVEPEQRSVVSLGEGSSWNLKPAHLLRFLGEGETQTCLLVVIIFQPIATVPREQGAKC